MSAINVIVMIKRNLDINKFNIKKIIFFLIKLLSLFISLKRDNLK